MTFNLSCCSISISTLYILVMIWHFGARLPNLKQDKVTPTMSIQLWTSRFLSLLNISNTTWAFLSLATLSLIKFVLTLIHYCCCFGVVVVFALRRLCFTKVEKCHCTPQSNSNEYHCFVRKVIIIPRNFLDHTVFTLKNWSIRVDGEFEIKIESLNPYSYTQTTPYCIFLVLYMCVLSIIFRKL